MLPSLHILTGAAIAKIIPNKAIAYPLAFLSHFILDAIPHRDFETNGHFQGFKSLKFWLFVLKLEFDVFISIFIISTTTSSSLHYREIVFGGFLGFLPDLLLGLSHIFRGFNFKRCIKGESIRAEVSNENPNTSIHKISNFYANFHAKIQNAFSKKKTHVFMRVFNQIITAIITIIILMF